MLDLSKEEVQVKRELKISKRPVSAAIVDDGSAIAVLSSNHHVTVYDLSQEKAKILKAIPLENEPRTIALSPGAEVLGAAFNGGIEVYSLHPDAVPTDRRAVNCDTVDSLAFSSDGTILLGTTLSSRSPTTVIVSAQHFSTDMPVEGLAQLWTTQVLFPRSSRDSSHASLLQESHADDENTWTFTYDRVYETFRAVRVDDLRNGHTYFTGPSSETLGVVSPTTLPAPSRDGRMVAAGFGGKLWIYGIPGRLDLPPEGGSIDGGSVGSVASTPERSNSTSGNGGSSRERGQLGTISVPQWQVLCDKMRNVFKRGREIGEVSSMAGIKFVRCDNGSERLVAVAGGGVDGLLGEEGEEEFLAIGGGRILLYDFGRRAVVGQKSVITLEVGDGIQGPVEVLEEPQNDIETEVDLVRRRTVAQRRNRDLRNARGEGSSAAPQLLSVPGTNTLAQRPTTSVGASGLDPFDEVDGEYESLDVMPYYHGDPRSRGTLQRAATAARNAPQTVSNTRYLRVVGPDGRPLPPNHQSPGPRSEDDNWVPPPPPYTPKSDNDRPLPLHLLQSLQGPPRFLQVDGPSPSPAGPLRSVSALERTRSTLGTMMRRPSVFRLTTNSSSTSLSVQPPVSRNINHSRSAPVSPAVGNPGPAHMGVLGREESAYMASRRQFAQQQTGRRGSASDALNVPHATPPPPQTRQVPGLNREHSAPPLLPHQYEQFVPQRRQPLPPPQPRAQQPPQQYYGTSLRPEVPPPEVHNRNSPLYRPTPTRRPSPGRSPSRGRRAAGGNLQETYASNPSIPVLDENGQPRRGSVRNSGGNMRPPRNVRGSVRRTASRPERSAAANVREAKRKRRQMGLEEMEKPGASCIVM